MVSSEFIINWSSFHKTQYDIAYLTEWNSTGLRPILFQMELIAEDYFASL